MGFDRAIFVESATVEELICCVCHDVLEDPVAYICGHYACNMCLVTWIRNGGRSCPICRQQGAVGIAPHVLYNVINSLLVRCLFESEGCTMTITLANRDNHAMTCTFRPEKVRFLQHGHEVTRHCCS